jgi:fibronectin type 3 domain-containing protein
VWRQGNNNGYVIDRYTIARNGALLSQPVKLTVTTSALKPIAESQWEPLVKRDRYAAIAAQALFGDRFEVDLSKSDIFTIVNKVKENEQRFAFALFAADMSVATAKASGLWFTDRTVKKGEKYLYRITIVESADSLRGSIFIAPEDKYSLTQPLNLHADFKGSQVSLRWDEAISGKYTAYVVERSDDGKTFAPVSETPLITVSGEAHLDSRYIYAADSIPDVTKTWYYRVRGITPFGEMSNPSDIVNGKGTVKVSDVPHIMESINVENKSIRIKWEFAESSNAAIQGFSVERASQPRGNFKLLTLQKPLPSSTRVFEDLSPNRVNYYKVTAHGYDGEKYSSPIFLATLIDSIPPMAPVDLKGVIDANGAVSLSWKANGEEDIYGYRVYKANSEKEEPSQITTEPIEQNSYRDSVNLKTLNESIYYSVMAIDRSQNHSKLSALLKLNLPDKIKPMPATFLPVSSDEKSVRLSWIKSSSPDVTQYKIYRKVPDKDTWQLINSAQATADTIFVYEDVTAHVGVIHNYTVIAIDEAGLESDPASPVSASVIDNKLRPPVEWKQVQIDRDNKQVVLRWDYSQEGVQSFRIYKAEGEQPPVLYRSVKGDKREFTDMLVVGKYYKYSILVLFESGHKSMLSKEQTVKF